MFRLRSVNRRCVIKNNDLIIHVRSCVRFSFFCSEPQKREKATVDHKRRLKHHHRDSLSLSLSLPARDTQTRAQKKEIKNRIVQSCPHVKLRIKETKLVRVCPLLLLFAANDERICCFFLSGGETTTTTLFLLFFTMAFVVSFALCHDALKDERERERDRQKDRKRDTSSSFRDDAFCVFSKSAGG